MRRDKTPTVIFTKKEKPQEIVKHCRYHSGSRMYYMSDGSLRCQICGSLLVAVREVDTS